MPTFLLKKYQESNVNQEQNEEGKTSEENKEPEQLTITVSGTISEIVAKALNKVLENKVEVSEISDTEEKDSSVKAITTESINSDPLMVLESIHKDDYVFIHNKGFKTSKEEWFLTNISNKTNNVFYTLESFITFVKNKFQV